MMRVRAISTGEKDRLERISRYTFFPMATFLARVELHNAKESDYETLHLQMAKRGFHRTIRGDDGVNYSLPPAEYYGTGSVSVVAAREAAKAAANATGKASGVIVVDWTSASWDGLEKA